MKRLQMGFLKRYNEMRDYSFRFYQGQDFNSFMNSLSDIDKKFSQVSDSHLIIHSYSSVTLRYETLYELS
jgi:hypothetical protein